MHCSMLSLARLNHFRNVDIVKLRKSERHIIRWRDDKVKTKSKGINARTHRGTDTHTYTAMACKPFRRSTAALQFPFVQFHCSGAFFARLIRILTLCLYRVAFCCFWKLHRTIILVWLHFGDIHTCFSLSFDFMPAEKIDSNSRAASFCMCLCVWVSICFCFCSNVWFGHWKHLFFCADIKVLLSKFGKYKRNRAENKIASPICCSVNECFWYMFSLWIPICLFE